MSEWKECRLSDVVASANTGLDAIRRAPILEKEIGLKCLRIQDISQKKSFNKWGNTEVKPDDFRKYQLKQNDIIMARTCSTGICTFIKNDMNAVFNNGLVRIRANTGRAFPAFLYYLFLSRDFIGHIDGISGGTSVQLNMQVGNLLSYEFTLPPLPEQRAIASVLSSLDDKIDLLHRQNKTLEGMAEVLWRKMFVEKADPGWKEGNFGDEMNITMGQSPPGHTYNEQKQGMVFFQGRAEFDFRFPQTRLYCTEPKRLAKKGDTLVSVRAPVGDINMAYEDCCIGRGLAAVRHKGDCTSYTFYKTRSLKDDFVSFEQQGTVFGSIGKDDFNNITTRVPSGEAVKEFEHAARPIDDKILTNSIQIRTLSRLRDTLLPKLMSGEVRVKL